MKKHYFNGMCYMLASSLFIAISAFFGKQLTSTIFLTTLITIRFFFIMMLQWLINLFAKRTKLEFHHLGLHFLRALLTALCQFGFYYCLTHSTILNATLLFLTSALFVPIISRILQKIPIKTKVLVSISIGFLGVIFILQPSANINLFPELIGLSAGFFNACSQIIFHQLTKKTNTYQILTFTYTFATLLSIIPLLIVLKTQAWQSITWTLSSPVIAALFFGVAVSGIINQIFRSKAYQQVNKAMSLSPFLYMSLVFAGILDWLVFNILPNTWSLIGIALVLVSASNLVINYERIKLRRA